MTDPVVASVAAYTADAHEYETTHASRRLEAAARFAAALAPGSPILDAGCGPGRDLARFAAAGLVPIGVDLNPEFAVRASAHAPVVLGDLRAVGSLFAPASFAGVWACASLVHLAEADAHDVLRQFARLLPPGGVLFASVMIAGTTGWLDEPDGRRFYTVWTADHFTVAVTAAGFTINAVEESSFVEVWATRVRAGTAP